MSKAYANFTYRNRIKTYIKLTIQSKLSDDDIEKLTDGIITIISDPNKFDSKNFAEYKEN